MRRGKLAGTAGLLATVALAVAPPAGATTIFTQTPESPYTGSGTSPTASFATGDFNGDGLPDLFQGDSAGTYRVWLNQGGGRFATPPGPSPVTGGTTPFVMTTGRFNGDGLDDVAITHLNSAGLTVLLATGGGAFSAAPGSPLLAAGGNGRAVAAGRLDADGKTDLVYVTQGGSLYVLRGDGAGTFAATPGSPLAIGSAPQIDVGRLDDGPTDDIALGISTPSSVRVLRSDSAGALTAAPGGDVSTGTNYNSIPHIADLDNDGLNDVVTSHSSNVDNVVSVLRGSATGALSAVLGSPFPAGGIGPYSTSDPARVGSDGNLDVVASMTQSQGLAVLQGDGTGRLSLMAGHPLVTAAPSPQGTLIRDFNGDGVSDIVYSVSNLANSLYVLLGRRAAIGDRSEMDFASVEVGTASAAQTLRVTNTADFAVPYGTTAVTGPQAAEFDRSSDTCSGRTVAAGASCEVIVRLLPAGAGARTATLTVLQDGDVLSVPLSGTGATKPAPTAAAFRLTAGNIAVGKISRTARRLTVRVKGLPKGTRVTLKVRTTVTLARATATVPASGSATLRAKLGPKARRTLRSRKLKRLRLTVTAAPPGGAPASITLTRRL